VEGPVGVLMGTFREKIFKYCPGPNGFFTGSKDNVHSQVNKTKKTNHQ